MHHRLRSLVNDAVLGLTGRTAGPAYLLRRLYQVLGEAKDARELLDMTAVVAGASPGWYRLLSTIESIERRGNQRCLQEMLGCLASFVLNADRFGMPAAVPWGRVTADPVAAIASIMTEDTSDHITAPWQRDFVEAARRVRIHVEFISKAHHIPTVGGAPPRHQPSRTISAPILESTGDNRPILFGRHEMMEELTGRDGDVESGAIPKRHPELDTVKFTHGVNPDLLVVLDQHSKIHGLGSHNCVTCRHFQANRPCPAWEDKGRRHVLNQDKVTHFSIGNCILIDLLPGLSAGHDPKYPHSPAMGNELYDEIIDLVINDDVFAVYRDGRYGTLTADDLGVGEPRRRSTEFDGEDE